MTNADTKLIAFRDRLTALEQTKRNAAEDGREIVKEMKSLGLSKAEISGVKLAVRRSFESADKAASRTEAEQIADQLALSGDAPLFGAAA